MYGCYNEGSYTDRLYIIVGERQIYIIVYRTVDINIDILNRNETFTITRINYVSNFITNVVLTKYLKVKSKISQDSRCCRIERDREIVFIYTKIRAYYRIESNIDCGEDIVLVFFAATRFGIVYNWY